MRKTLSFPTPIVLPKLSLAQSIPAQPTNSSFVLYNIAYPTLAFHDREAVNAFLELNPHYGVLHEQERMHLGCTFEIPHVIHVARMADAGKHVKELMYRHKTNKL